MSQNGLLTKAEVKRLGAGERRVYDLMKDGNWHHSEAIIKAASKGERLAQGGLRRMRELRTLLIVSCRRVQGTYFHEYRITGRQVHDDGRHKRGTLG